MKGDDMEIQPFLSQPLLTEEPSQAQSFQSNEGSIDQKGNMMFAAASEDTTDDTELGGLEREVDITDGTSILLLLSLGYYFKCYRSRAKNKK